MLDANTEGLLRDKRLLCFGRVGESGIELDFDSSQYL